MGGGVEILRYSCDILHRLMQRCKNVANSRVNRVIAYKKMSLFLPSYEPIHIDSWLNPPPPSNPLFFSWERSLFSLQRCIFFSCIDAPHLRRSSFLLSTGFFFIADRSVPFFIFDRSEFAPYDCGLSRCCQSHIPPQVG